MLVSFRPCGPKDHKTLLRLVVAYYRFDKIPYSLASLSRGLDTLLRNLSQGQAWLMETHHKAVGYAIVTYNFDLEYGGVEGMLTDLYVEKRFRNRGVGSLALYEIEDFCRERGIRAVGLQVQHHNKAAEIFYRKAGFRLLPRKVMLFEVRPEEKSPTRRASAGKRR
ncbi:MAG TPA: GNAT family N-acetyltransferase [Candidatus Limnocylindrales bacterium]|nr:GNAT family N-acetyltransferase [Candidatus Limnocylindrales bacterium]